MNENVLKLAEMLGVGAQELVAYFVVRAPLEIVDFYVACAAVGLGIVLVLIGLIAVREDNEVVSVACGLPGLFMVVFGLIMMAAEGIEAYKAVGAPEAYAVEQIMDAINGRP